MPGVTLKPSSSPVPFPLATTRSVALPVAGSPYTSMSCTVEGSGTSMPALMVSVMVTGPPLG